MIVVKLGGSLLESRRLRAAALRSIAARWSSSGSLVLVHGGGRRVDAGLDSLGIPRRTHRGLRVTDGPTLDVVVSVLCGLVNKELVAELDALGVASAGISGADGGTLRARLHPPLDGVDLGLVGQVTAARPSLVRSVLNAGMLPVVASLAMGPAGTLLNVNADAAAAELAVALEARRLVFLTDVEGLLDEAGQVVKRLSTAQARSLLSSDVVGGGMRPKLSSCLEALTRGVHDVIIAGPARHAAALGRGSGGTRLVAA